MSYRFGPEIATFHLSIHRSGECFGFDWDYDEALINPETLRVIPEDDETFIAFNPCPDGEQAMAWPNVKALKEVWAIRLNHSADGAMGYERSEGIGLGDYMEDWAIQAAAIFKGRRPVRVPPVSPTPAIEGLNPKVAILDEVAFDELLAAGPDPMDPERCDSFHALFSSHWGGHGEDAELTIDFLGELDLDSLKAKEA